MTDDRYLLIHDPELLGRGERVLGAGFRAMSERVLQVTEPHHGLRLNLAERVFINQGCTFLDCAGIRLGEGVMDGSISTFITRSRPGDRLMIRSGSPRSSRRQGKRRDQPASEPIDHAGRTLAAAAAAADLSGVTPGGRP